MNKAFASIQILAQMVVETIVNNVLNVGHDLRTAKGCPKAI